MKTILLILICLNLSAQKDGSGKHFYAGMGITMGTSEIVLHYTNKTGLACLSGMAMGVSAGFAKEYIWDRKLDRGTFSKWDIFYTAWGSLVGGIVERCWIDWRENKRQRNFNKRKYTLDL